MADQDLKVLVVDDTVVFRSVVRDILKEIPGVEVVGTAANGKIAVSKMSVLKPDLLTLDIEMPEMNGLEVLEHIRSEGLDIGAIMLSTLTSRGGDITMKALELGAFDFITKPQKGGVTENRELLLKDFTPKLKAYIRHRQIRNIFKGKEPFLKYKSDREEKFTSTRPARQIRMASDQIRGKSEIIAIGISTGGPNALSQVLPALPNDLNVPILVVQHMPPVFTQSLASSLDKKCKMEVREARDGVPVVPNTILIAPGGKQMKLVAGADGRSRIIRITDDPPENSCKPSVDYLFRSIAQHYIGRTTGVIMTGMGTDGTASLKIMKQNGATIIAQDEATCVVYGMPKEVVEAGIADVVAPLDRIAEEICRTVRLI